MEVYTWMYLDVPTRAEQSYREPQRIFSIAVSAVADSLDEAQRLAIARLWELPYNGQWTPLMHKKVVDHITLGAPFLIKSDQKDASYKLTYSTLHTR